MMRISGMEDEFTKVYFPEVSFECGPQLECGNCCRIAPADLTEEEYFRILELGFRRFAVRTDIALFRMVRKGDACFFLENYACKIYPHRPASCRALPFLPAFFDFYEQKLVILFDPTAFSWCKGVGGEEEGEMDRRIVKECSRAALQLFVDRFKIIAEFRDELTAFLLAALSTPEKSGIIAGRPHASLCYCCGLPLRITDNYRIYSSIFREYEVVGNVLVCRRCRKDVKNEAELENLQNIHNLENLRNELFFGEETRKTVKKFLKNLHEGVLSDHSED
jgi:Fe-S-cluster containining protein